MSETTLVQAGHEVVTAVDILAEMEKAPSSATSLELVRLDANETALIPFTTAGARVQIHYLDDPDVRGYVQCNGPDCILCRVGRKPDARTLLPVYIPTERRVGVLAIPDTARPGSLKPQLQPILKRKDPQVLLISKPDRAKFIVSSMPLVEGMDNGAAVIKSFTDEYTANVARIASVYQTLDNALLAEVPSVAAMMQVKGIRLDAAH